MSKEMIIQEVDRIVETINEQWETIRQYKGKIPFIEMDIFIDNLRKFYEEVILLEKLNKEKVTEYLDPVIPKPAIFPAKVDTAVQLDSGTVENGIPAVNPAKNNITPEKTILPSAEKPDTTNVINLEIVESGPEEPVAVTNPLKKPTTLPLPDLFGQHSPTLAEKFQAERKTVKDQFPEQGNDNSLGSRIQQSQIQDLKSAIGINDKFLFINELFKGDLAGYNRTIESLNSSFSRQDAYNKLELFGRQFHWPENSSSLNRLRDFLKRRYPD